MGVRARVPGKTVPEKRAPRREAGVCMSPSGGGDPSSFRVCGTLNDSFSLLHD